MSLVMAYILLWMAFIHKQECAVIRYHRNQNAFEYVIQKYMKPLRRLSADLPNHAIEMEIEIHGSAPKTTNDPRRFIRLINPRPPKPIPRAQDGAEGAESPSVADAAATTAVIADTGLVTAAPAAIPAAPAGTDPEPQKIPVFMEDLKKALDDLEKKLITNAENSAAVTTSGNAPSTGVVGGQSQNAPMAAPVRSIDDIVQLLKKGIHVEHRMPKIGDEKLEWVQIKIPKSMQL